MKIIFYTNSFFPDPIGIAYYNTEWVEELQRQRHAVEVLTSMPYYPQWKIPQAYQGRWTVRETYQGIPITRRWLYVPGSPRAVSRFLCELSLMLSSFGTLFFRRADLIIAVTPPFGMSLAAACVARWRQRPFWLHVQDLQVDAGSAVGFLKNQRLVRILKWLEAWVWRQATVVTTISEAMKHRIEEREPRVSVSLFPNWVDTRAMSPQPKKNAFREKTGTRGQFVVLYSGSLGIHQGLGDLLTAAGLLRSDPGIRFVIVGEGNHRAALMKQAEQAGLDQIVWLPLQPKESLAEMLSSADVGLVMEIRQMSNLSMPSKILNQMACGRPILAMADEQSLLAKTLRASGAGVVVPPGSPERLAQQIRELRQSTEELARMGVRAREFVEKNHEAKRLFAAIPGFLKSATPASAYREYPLKRMLDRVLALAGFLISAPLWILIPLAIKLEDGGPVFFSQVRSGRLGRPFGALKFRSLRLQDHNRDRRQAMANDPRATRVGALLRETALDELPQLWNILWGDLSFVGPRALLPSEIEVGQEHKGEVSLEAISGYSRRLWMRPGLTGIAQVYASRELPRRQKFRYDLIYLQARSLRLDLCLILRSLWNTATAGWGRVGRG